VNLILGISSDLSSSVSFDSDLLAIPDSGMYINTGVHPSITIDNLLKFLPKLNITFTAYVAGTSYGKYTDTLQINDIVEDGGLIYQSKVKGNLGNTPATSPTEWLLTNIDSLRVRNFALSSQKKAIGKLNLNRRLLDSQYLYNVADLTESPNTTMLPNNYAAWVFEAKGSDYVKFQINEVAFQATTATPQSLYVINQGVLIDTLTLNPNVDGRLVFEDISYTFAGKGRFILAVDSQNVLTNGASIDPLKYDGFVAYMSSGIGATPQGANWSDQNMNNGLNFNVKVSLDSTAYLKYNLVDYPNFVQAQWELDVLEMFVFNPNDRSNSNERTQLKDRELIIGETKNGKMEGSALYKYNKEFKAAKIQLGKTFDRGISPKSSGGQSSMRTA
tara:strand:- start:465 stop:1628 length:1164 start_codon:yes stop_codon:yes gene_type:complete